MVIDVLNDDSLIPVLADWIALDDLVELDSSLTNHTVRMFFLELISNDNFAHKGSEIPLSNGCLLWLNKRGVKIKHLNLMLFKDFPFSQTVLTYIRAQPVIDTMEVHAQHLLDILSGFKGKIKDLEVHRLDPTHFNCMEAIGTGITSLCIEDTKLTEQSVQDILTYIPNLTSIVFILPSSKHLPGKSLISIAEKYRSMEKLRIDEVKLTDEQIHQITTLCPKLTRVALFNSNITPLGLITIVHNCQCLLRLEVAGNRSLDDTVFLKIAPQCRNLRGIDFSDCKITSTGICALAEHCTKLESVAFRNNRTQIDSALILLFKSNSNLNEVDLDYCFYIEDFAILTLLDYCPKIRKLSLTKTAISGTVYLRLLQLHNIESLQLTKSPPESAYPYAVNIHTDKYRHRLRSLRVDELGDCMEYINDNFMLCAVLHMSQLQVLKLFDCVNLTDDAVAEAICRYCPLLHSISVSNSLTPNASYIFAEHYKTQLTSFQWNNILVLYTPEWLSNVLVHCGGNLTRLNISNCDGLEDISCITEYCPKLQRLDVSHNRLITPMSILHVIHTYTSQLTHLILYNCVLMTNEVVNTIVDTCTQKLSQLVELDIRGCKKIQYQKRIATILRDAYDTVEKVLYDE